MIRNAKPGTIVQFRYANRSMIWHGMTAHVLACATGPGPRNVLVESHDGEQVVVPSGNLIRHPNYQKSQPDP